MKLLTKKRKARRMKAIRAALRTAHIRYFKARELVSHHNPAWEYDRLYPPPTRMAENIVPTVSIADEIRKRWGAAVRCLSGHRCPPYNDLVGGAEDSQHQYFTAMDLQPYDGDFQAFVEMVKEVVAERRAKGEIIGLGIYDTFVHIDTQHPDGEQRNW